MRNFLVTGFEPWGRLRSNPSGAVARAFGGVVLPVDFDRADPILRRAVVERRPKALVLLGLAERRRRISLEAVALNVDHHGGRRGPIARGPLALATRLPVEALLAKLVAARIPAEISHHAGTFLCNHVFYVALRETKLPCGFVHVPPARVLSIERQVRAVRIILESLG
jgi:pyroglutamyl-peptidase